MRTIQIYDNTTGGRRMTIEGIEKMISAELTAKKIPHYAVVLDEVAAWWQVNIPNGLLRQCTNKVQSIVDGYVTPEWYGACIPTEGDVDV